MSTLIVYFSAESGKTRKVAKVLMDETGGTDKGGLGSGL